MQQWEYKVEEISAINCAESFLNWFGRAGWELIEILCVGKRSYAVFKRPEAPNMQKEY